MREVPMWTTENRYRYDRDKLRYPSDLTDAEWANVAPLIPPAKRGGGKRTVNMREVVNGVMYVRAPAANGAMSPRTCRRAKPPQTRHPDTGLPFGWNLEVPFKPPSRSSAGRSTDRRSLGRPTAIRR
jgi:transposase